MYPFINVTLIIVKNRYEILTDKNLLKKLHYFYKNEYILYFIIMTLVSHLRI